jgi:hypothetical protein
MITGIPQSYGHILVFRHHWARGTHRRVVDNWPNRIKAIESYVRCSVDMLRWSFS